MNYVIGLFEEAHLNELMDDLKQASMADSYTVIDRYNLGDEVLWAVPGTPYATGAAAPAGTAGVAAVVDVPPTGDGVVPNHVSDLMDEYDLSDEEKAFFARSVADGAYFIAVETPPEQICQVRQMMEQAQAQHIHVVYDEDFDEKWEEIKTKLQAKWHDLTDNELDDVKDDWHRLTARLQEKYGSSKTELRQLLGSSASIFGLGQTHGSNGHATGQPNLLSATTAIGDDIVNGQGEKLGTLKELMFNVNTGTIGYAVLAFDEGLLANVMGNNKLFAVPWNLLSLDAENHRFVLHVDRSLLENAPGFDQDNWPDHDHPYWTTDIDRYYGR